MPTSPSSANRFGFYPFGGGWFTALYNLYSGPLSGANPAAELEIYFFQRLTVLVGKVCQKVDMHAVGVFSAVRNVRTSEADRSGIGFGLSEYLRHGINRVESPISPNSCWGDRSQSYLM